jgi:hypothetical protein
MPRMRPEGYALDSDVIAHATTSTSPEYSGSTFRTAVELRRRVIGRDGGIQQEQYERE